MACGWPEHARGRQVIELKQLYTDPETTGQGIGARLMDRSEEHTSELQSLMRTSYAVFCLNKKNTKKSTTHSHIHTYQLRITQTVDYSEHKQHPVHTPH